MMTINEVSIYSNSDHDLEYKTEHRDVNSIECDPEHCMKNKPKCFFREVGMHYGRRDSPFYSEILCI